MTKIRWKIILTLFINAWIIGVIFEYFGWKVAGRYIDEAVFPGLLHIDPWLGGLKTTGGGFFMGFLFLVIFIAFPGFRSGFPGNAHKPLIAGVIFVYIGIGTAIMSGFL